MQDSLTNKTLGFRSTMVSNSIFFPSTYHTPLYRTKTEPKVNQELDQVEVDLVEGDVDVATVTEDQAEVDQAEVDDSCDYVYISMLPEVCSPV